MFYKSRGLFFLIETLENNVTIYVIILLLFQFEHEIKMQEHFTP